MSTKFFCNSESCINADKGPFVLELAQEAVMDGNNLATIFCPRCGKPMKPVPAAPQKAATNRFFCHNEACATPEHNIFFIDLPGEAIMDKNNLAAIFCPKCGKTMTATGPDSNVVVNF